VLPASRPQACSSNIMQLFCPAVLNCSAWPQWPQRPSLQQAVVLLQLQAVVLLQLQAVVLLQLQAVVLLQLQAVVLLCTRAESVPRTASLLSSAACRLASMSRQPVTSWPSKQPRRLPGVSFSTVTALQP